MTFSLGYDLKIFYLVGGLILVGGVYWSIFLGGGMSEFLVGGGNSPPIPFEAHKKVRKLKFRFFPSSRIGMGRVN